jgi:hypothetical protein
MNTVYTCDLRHSATNECPSEEGNLSGTILRAYVIPGFHMYRPVTHLFIVAMQMKAA